MVQIFARSHNLTKGWVGLGNQLDGVNVSATAIGGSMLVSALRLVGQLAGLHP
jgi:hypothetical protein